MVVLLMGVLGNEILSASAIMRHLEEHPDPDRKFYVSDMGWADKNEMPPVWVRFKTEILSWFNDEGVIPAPHTMSGTTTVSPATINWNDRPFPFWPLQADQVIILTNPQFRRQCLQRPKKLDWAKWYVEQEIPVYIMDGNHELIQLHDGSDINFYDQIEKALNPKTERVEAQRPKREWPPFDADPKTRNPFHPDNRQQPYNPEDNDMMKKMLDMYRKRYNPESYYDYDNYPGASA